MNIIIFIKKHWLALSLALVVGFIAIAPTWLSINELGDQYKGVIYSGSADDYTYLARMQEILDGHGLVGSAFYYEYKHFKPLVLPIGEYFYAVPAFLFNVSLVNVLIYAKFLFPAILFLLTYILVYSLIQGDDSFLKKFYSSVVGIFITLGYGLIDYKNAWETISGQISLFGQILWTRPVNPVTGAILILIFLLLTWKLVNRNSGHLSFFAGLILGLTIYYFFSWGIAVSFLVIFSFIFLLKKEFKTALNLGIVFFVSLLLSSYFWFNYFNLIRDKSVLINNGMFFTHAPMLNKLVAVSLIIFIPCFLYDYYKSKKEKQELPNWWWFCLSLLVSSAVVYNQQIITGRTIWPYHFVQYTIPFCIIAMMVLYYNFIKPTIGKFWIFLPVVIIIFSFLLNVGPILNYRNNLNDYKLIQKNAVIFDWIKNNAPRDCVILALGGRLEQFIPAFTQCNNYMASWNISGVSQERVIHNYLVYLKMRGVDDKQVGDYLNANKSEVVPLFYSDWKELLGDYVNEPLLEKGINEISFKYKEFYKKNFEMELKKYRLDYIILEDELSANLMKELKIDKSIFNSNDIFIYSFK